MCLFCGGDFGCTLASWLRRSVCHELVQQILVVRKLPLESLKLVVVGGGLEYHLLFQRLCKIARWGRATMQRAVW